MTISLGIFIFYQLLGVLFFTLPHTVGSVYVRMADVLICDVGHVAIGISSHDVTDPEGLRAWRNRRITN